MNPAELATQALADLQSKADAAITDARGRAADAKARLEQGLLNLRSQGDQGAAPVASADTSSPEGDLSWGFDPGSEIGADEFASAPPEALTFKDELDVATDDDGIPLGD